MTETIRAATITRLRRIVRSSMVLQVLRLRVLAATQRFTRTGRTARGAATELCGAAGAENWPAGWQSSTAWCSRCSSKEARPALGPAVMLMPARFQVNDEDYGHLRDAVTQSGGTLVRDAAGERIDQALGDLPVPRFDVLPPLRAAGGGRVLPAHRPPDTARTRNRGRSVGPLPSRVAPASAMVFNSLHFVGFFLVVYALYRVLPHRAQNWLLLAPSYYFYAAWDWRFLGLLVGSTVVDLLRAAG